MRLEDDELRDVLARAEEIQQNTLDGDAARAEFEAVLQAAEEVGLARYAVERALRERLNLPHAPPAVGDLAFAKSADGKFYVAEILSREPHGFRVRFLRGSEHVVASDELRPCSLLPGTRVVVDWPWWGTWTVTVLSYDAETRMINASDGGGSTRVFPIADIWINSPRTAVEKRRTRTRVHVALLGAGATLGAIVGSAITALLLR